MAYARTVYNVDASKATLPDPSNRQFEVDFEYISKDHISVLVDGTETTFFSWVNNARIQLDDPTVAGQVVTLLRESSPATRLVDYQTGSVLSEEILDKDSLQGFYLAQEANDIKEVALSRNGANHWEADNSRVVNVADPVDNQDAANKQWVLSATATQVGLATSAKDLALQAQTLAQNNQLAAEASAATAGQNNQSALAHANTALGYKNTTNAYKTDVIALLAAASIPNALANKAGQFLQVKADETGYLLVSSVAAPSFYGFKMSADGQSIELTYGRDADYNVDDYETWTMAENVNYSVTNNNLVVNL
jgi:hypothetical protein